LPSACSGKFFFMEVLMDGQAPGPDVNAVENYRRFVPFAQS
jgi:hypothetical protein